MNRENLLIIIMFPASVAGLFLVVSYFVKLLEKIFHIHLN